MSSTDTRIINTLPSHPKTRKLIKRHGQAAGWNLICLFLFVSSNRPDGNLFGMDAEDIELAADWSGADGEFVTALTDFGFLDCTEEGYAIHDWSEHNPWAASSGLRTLKARWNAVKRHHGEEEACRQVPEYHPEGTAVKATGDATSTDIAVQGVDGSNAPLPTQSVSKPKHKAKPLALARFAEFWSVYPRRDDKAKAMQAWSKHGCDALADAVITGAKRYAAEKADSERRYIALPSSWLNGQRWEDAGMTASSGNGIEVTV